MIKLIAKKGSELEQTLKEMAEQMDKNLADGKRIVKEATGVEPESIGYRWAWGDECDRRLRQSKIEGKYVLLNL